jgi:cytidylate kinase
MAVVTVSGEPGCRTREVAQLTAQRLSFQHVSASRLDSMLEEEFGPPSLLTEKVWPELVATILIRHAVEEDMVVGVDGAERLFGRYPGLLRVRVIAPVNRRIGNLMLDDRLDRATAREHLRDREKQQRILRKLRFGRATPDPSDFDLILNAEIMDGAHMAAIIECAIGQRGLLDLGYLSRAAEAQMQFKLRYQLSKEGIQPKGKASLRRAAFVHPSEQIFANLLDFYRIAWEYEPRSFPIQWDKDGKVLESFTPDFYLPESDMYVELTTMKQSLVTKKNRKIKLLRAIYPGINIQVFYQKDVQDLIFKYGLAEEPARA